MIEHMSHFLYLLGHGQERFTGVSSLAQKNMAASKYLVCANQLLLTV